MQNDEYRKLKQELDSLPTGGITYKKINGKEYAYYQWREDGKQRSRRAKEDELPFLTIQIERRKELEGLMKGRNGLDKTVVLEYPYYCVVRTGEKLRRFVVPVSSWKKRNCYKNLHDYIYEEVYDRVFILYGLRRTGKTTLMRQLIAEMDEQMMQETVYIQMSKDSTWDDLYKDLIALESQGYRYVFIDEVTLAEGFIGDSALLSDIFAASGMKIVLSGTDSLGFMLAEGYELYDRCFICHTTFIPYHEFEQVLGIQGIDEYIQYGGTMSISDNQYHDSSILFASKEKINAYVDSAIAHNIQHSLKYYQYGTHFRSLGELYEKNELTSVINRVVEDVNHRFTIEVLTKDFKSNDLSISAKNLRRDREHPIDLWSWIDKENVIKQLKELLDIKNREEQTVKIEDAHRVEIREYLDILDLTVDVECRKIPHSNQIGMRTIISQPGLRYAQAEALVKSFLRDEKFSGMHSDEKKMVLQRIMNEIKGRMMEDIVLLETQMARKNCEVFCLQFAIGEFDMVVYDEEKNCCEIYEIKHSIEAVSEQRRYLLDKKKRNDTEFRYGKIVGTYIIYRGNEMEIDGVKYLNVEEYLKALELHTMR